MKIFYFGELIADTKTETEINDEVVRARIDLLHETQEITKIDLENDTYQSVMPIRQLALV